MTSSGPFAFQTSGRGDLTFLGHMTRLSAVEASEQFPCAVRGSWLSFFFGECVNLHSSFGFLVRIGIQCADVHSVRVSWSRQSSDSEESGQLPFLTDCSYLVEVEGQICGSGVVFDDFADDGWINVLLDDVDQLSGIELSGLAIGLEFDDPFINRQMSLFELSELFPCPVLLIGWSEKFFHFLAKLSPRVWCSHV